MFFLAISVGRFFLMGGEVDKILIQYEKSFRPNIG